MSEGLSFRRARATRSPGLGPFVFSGIALTALGVLFWWLVPSTPDGILVEVRGDVPRPGFHRIEAHDLRGALAAAGHEAPVSATPLHEGDLVRVSGEGVTIHPGGNPLLFGLPVDVNNAGPDALEAVPGLGRGLALAIVADRERRGPYYAVADLARVPGIGPSTVEELAPLLTVGDVGPRPEPPVIVLDTADALQLEALPGIGPVLAARIVVDRDENGPYTSLEQLDRVQGIGPATLADLAALQGAGRLVLTATRDEDPAPDAVADEEPAE